QAAAHGPNVVSVDDVFVVEQLRDLDDGNSQQENAGIGVGVLCDQQVERGGSDRQVEQPAQPAVQIEMVRSEQEKPVEQRIGGRALEGSRGALVIALLAGGVQPGDLLAEVTFLEVEFLF